MVEPRDYTYDYSGDFQAQDYLFDAGITPTSRIEWTPGEVFVRGRKGQSRVVEMVYRLAFNAPCWVRRVEFEGEATRCLGGDVSLSLSTNGQTWIENVVRMSEQPDYRLTGTFRGTIAVETGYRELKNLQGLWVRFTLSAPDWTDTARAAALRAFRVRGSSRAEQ